MSQTRLEILRLTVDTVTGEVKASYQVYVQNGSFEGAIAGGEARLDKDQVDAVKSEVATILKKVENLLNAQLGWAELENTSDDLVFDDSSSEKPPTREEDVL